MWPKCLGSSYQRSLSKQKNRQGGERERRRDLGLGKVPNGFCSGVELEQKDL